eukprot:8203-Heterococcus_DN1.PRE.1
MGNAAAVLHPQGHANKHGKTYKQRRTTMPSISHRSMTMTNTNGDLDERLRLPSSNVMLSAKTMSMRRRGTHTGGSMLHRDAASSDLDRLSHFFRELLCDPGLRGCFRDFLAQEHLAEHMALFWVEAEHVKRAVQRFNRSLKNFGSADVDVRTLYTEAVSKCDDLCKRFLHEGAMHNVATWVEADTRYD